MRRMITLIGTRVIRGPRRVVCRARAEFQQSKMSGRKFQLAVCGLHLTGLPLNWQLTDLGATLVKACKSAAEYR
jgi:hypothetical protein